MPLHEASSLVLEVVDSFSSSLAFPLQASGGALQGAEELLSDLLAEGGAERDVAVAAAAGSDRGPEQPERVGPTPETPTAGSGRSRGGRACGGTGRCRPTRGRAP